MTGTNSAVTGKFCDPPVIVTGITPRFISRPVSYIESFSSTLLLFFADITVVVRFPV
jgi:hypothetical protein